MSPKSNPLHSVENLDPLDFVDLRNPPIVRTDCTLHLSEASLKEPEQIDRLVTAIKNEFGPCQREKFGVPLILTPAPSPGSPNSILRLAPTQPVTLELALHPPYEWGTYAHEMKKLLKSVQGSIKFSSVQEMSLRYWDALTLEDLRDDFDLPRFFWVMRPLEDPPSWLKKFARFRFEDKGTELNVSYSIPVHFNGNRFRLRYELTRTNDQKNHVLQLEVSCEKPKAFLQALRPVPSDELEGYASLLLHLRCIGYVGFGCAVRDPVRTRCGGAIDGF